MNLAFVYAGQGSQHAGMGRDFYQEFPLYREVIDNLDVDFDLKQISFEGPEEVLTSTPSPVWWPLLPGLAPCCRRKA